MIGMDTVNIQNTKPKGMDSPGFRCSSNMLLLNSLTTQKLPETYNVIREAISITVKHPAYALNVVLSFTFFTIIYETSETIIIINGNIVFIKPPILIPEKNMIPSKEMKHTVAIIRSV